MLKLLKNSLINEMFGWFFLLLLRHDNSFTFPRVLFLYTVPTLFDHTSCILVMSFFFLRIFLYVQEKNELTLRASEFTFHNPCMPFGPVLNRLHVTCVFCLTRFHLCFCRYEALHRIHAVALLLDVSIALALNTR